MDNWHLHFCNVQRNVNLFGQADKLCMKENKFCITTNYLSACEGIFVIFHGPQIHCLWFCFFCNIMALQISILNTGKRTDWVRNHKWLHHEHRLDFFWNIWCIQDVCKNTVLFYKYDRITKKYNIFFPFTVVKQIPFSSKFPVRLWPFVPK